MESNARNAYLEADVRTATPQRLRLLLLDGALRFVRKTQAHLAEGRNADALEAEARARQILVELMGSIRNDGSDLTNKVFALYAYLFETLTRAQLQRQPAALNDVIQVLEYERETWRLVCEQFPQSQSQQPPAQHAGSALILDA